MALGDGINSLIKEYEVEKDYVAEAQEGLWPKEEVLDKINSLSARLDTIDDELADQEAILSNMQEADYLKDGRRLMELTEEFGSLYQVRDKVNSLRAFREQLANQIDDLQKSVSGKKNFDKKLCFSNIRELLKRNPDVKIGQIEKEAGIRLGYMSRLEKEGNTAEPSMEFIITAAKLLKVSVDTLVTIDLNGLTPHEQYITKFFDKLKADTVADKLDWKREKAHVLNNMEPDINGFTDHPLFSLERFTEEVSEGDIQEVTKVVFQSKSFGYNTYIKDDCFNLRLKNGTVLYLMSISRSVYRVSDPNATAIEAWMYVPHTDCSILVSSRDKTQVAPLALNLYRTVKEQMEHPKISKGALYAIDSFMKDDLADDKFDDGDDIPF